MDGSWRSVRDMETEVGPVTLPFTSLFMNGPGEEGGPFLRPTSEG